MAHALHRRAELGPVACGVVADRNDAADTEPLHQLRIELINEAKLSGRELAVRERGIHFVGVKRKHVPEQRGHIEAVQQAPDLCGCALFHDGPGGDFGGLGARVPARDGTEVLFVREGQTGAPPATVAQVAPHPDGVHPQRLDGIEVALK